MNMHDFGTISKTGDLVRHFGKDQIDFITMKYCTNHVTILYMIYARQLNKTKDCMFTYAT